MSFIFGKEYFEIKSHGLSQFQTMAAYMGGSAFQTIVDNPVTAYRQLVQQYAKGLDGKAVDPRIASQEARAIFYRAPIAASFSGIRPRLVGVGIKRIPSFGILLGISFLIGEDGNVGYMVATGASIMAAPIINPIRMIEKQQRTYFKQTGVEKPVMDILRESSAQRFVPLFRGTVPHIGHSLASALLGLVGQPKLQKDIQRELGSKTTLGQFAAGLIASAVVSPIYVAVTNPLSRLEVIMQTSKISGKPIGVGAAIKEVIADSKEFGLRGVFRGQGIGIVKAVYSLTMFHQGRLWLADAFKSYNVNRGLYDPLNGVVLSA